MKPKHLNKVRDMAGVRPGSAGTAGRAGGNHLEKRAGAAPAMTGYSDVGRACEAWLMKNDPAHRERREYLDRVFAERKERRETAEGGKP